MPVRVLLAEDEAMIALWTADLLEAEGFAVTSAGDGVEALAQARRLGGAIDLLVTDLNMPRLGGEGLIRALRAERARLPVVVLTGSPPLGAWTRCAAWAGTGRWPCLASRSTSGA
jgi:CheY-like chemotaxis protein